MTSALAAPAPTVSILDAMDDRDLFGPLFKGGTWKPWRAFLAALFGLPMDAAAVALYQRHTGRNTPPLAAFVEAALICGRRAGKSRVLALVATYLAVFRDYRPYLAPGEAPTIAVICADRKQGRTILRYILGMFNSVALLRPLLAGQTAESVTLTTGVQIEIFTASFRAARGYSLAAVLADELAFWRDDSSANPDTEILRAVRPGLSNLPGAMLLLASSPYAKRGELYKTFRRHYGQDGARVLV